MWLWLSRKGAWKIDGQMEARLALINLCLVAKLENFFYRCYVEHRGVYLSTSTTLSLK